MPAQNWLAVLNAIGAKKDKKWPQSVTVSMIQPPGMGLPMGGGSQQVAGADYLYRENTGAGPDGIVQPRRPVQMIQTPQGPRMLHEGETKEMNRNGTMDVIPAPQTQQQMAQTPQGQQKLEQIERATGMPGYAEGGTDIVDVGSHASNVVNDPSGYAQYNLARQTPKPAPVIPATTGTPASGTANANPNAGIYSGMKSAYQQIQNIAQGKDPYTQAANTRQTTAYGAQAGNQAAAAYNVAAANPNLSDAGARAMAAGQQGQITSGLSNLYGQIAEGDAARRYGAAQSAVTMAPTITQEARTQADWQSANADKEWERVATNYDLTNPTELAAAQAKYQQIYGGEPLSLQALQDKQKYVRDKQNQDVMLGNLNISSTQLAQVITAVNNGATADTINSMVPGVNLSPDQFRSLATKYGLEVQAATISNQAAQETLSQLKDSPKWNAMSIAAAAGDFDTAGAIYKELTGKDLDYTTQRQLAEISKTDAAYTSFRNNVLVNGMGHDEAIAYLGQLGITGAAAENSWNGVKDERRVLEGQWANQLRTTAGTQMANYFQTRVAADPNWGKIDPKTGQTMADPIATLQNDPQANQLLEDYWKTLPGYDGKSWRQSQAGIDWATGMFRAATISKSEQVANTITGSSFYRNASATSNDPTNPYKNTDGTYTREFYDDKVIPYVQQLQAFGAYSFSWDEKANGGKGELVILDSAGKPISGEDEAENYITNSTYASTFSQNNPDAIEVSAPNMAEYIKEYAAANKVDAKKVPIPTTDEWNAWVGGKVIAKEAAGVDVGGYFARKDGKLYKKTGNSSFEVAPLSETELTANPWSTDFTAMANAKGSPYATKIINARRDAVKKNATSIDATEAWLKAGGAGIGPNEVRTLDSDKTIKTIRVNGSSPDSSSVENWGLANAGNEVFRVILNDGTPRYFFISARKGDQRRYIEIGGNYNKQLFDRGNGQAPASLLYGMLSS